MTVFLSVVFKWEIRKSIVYAEFMRFCDSGSVRSCSCIEGFLFFEALGRQSGWTCMAERCETFFSGYMILAANDGGALQSSRGIQGSR